MGDTFERRLVEHYTSLSAKLRLAGDYIAAHPLDVASRSLRSIANESGLAPATFSRLARALDYTSFEELREGMRLALDRRVNSFSERAERLMADHSGALGGFFGSHLAACMGNLSRTGDEISEEDLEHAVARLARARKVRLLGALGSTGAVEYLSYMANFIADNWQILSRMGASLGTGLVDLDSRDVLVILTKPPFARHVIKAAEVAQAQGVFLIVISDTHACPALKYADTGFVVPTETPHFYSSYAATIFLIETIVGMVASQVGGAGRARIRQVEDLNRRLEEVQDA